MAWTTDLIKTLAAGCVCYESIDAVCDVNGHCHAIFETYEDTYTLGMEIGLYYATNASGSWVVEAIDTITETGADPFPVNCRWYCATISMDNSGNPHVTYDFSNTFPTPDSSTIVHAYKSGGSWTKSTIATISLDNGVDLSRHCIDGNGEVHFLVRKYGEAHSHHYTSAGEGASLSILATGCAMVWTGSQLQLYDSRDGAWFSYDGATWTYELITGWTSGETWLPNPAMRCGTYPLFAKQSSSTVGLGWKDGAGWNIDDTASLLGDSGPDLVRLVSSQKYAPRVAFLADPGGGLTDLIVSERAVDGTWASERVVNGKEFYKWGLGASGRAVSYLIWAEVLWTPSTYGKVYVSYKDNTIQPYPCGGPWWQLI